MDDNAEWRATETWPYHICAGGVVFRKLAEKIEVTILVRHENDGDHYHLPKGTLCHNETLEDCAIRETFEESGKNGKIIGYLGAIQDQFTHPRSNIFTDKITHYFAMEFTDEVTSHDSEHDAVQWIEISEARRLLEETENVKQEYLVIDRLKKFFNLE